MHWESGSWKPRKDAPSLRPPLPRHAVQVRRTRKITIAHCREHKLTHLVVYCTNFLAACNHSAHIALVPFHDTLSLSDIEPRCRCTLCGTRGADVRPVWVEDLHRKRDPLPAIYGSEL